MAIVNPLQQRLMMERMRRDPRLAALMAARGEGGLAELAGLPQGAMNLAELAGMAPPAQVVTPAQPAPVQPGAEVRAPTETVAGEEVPAIPKLKDTQRTQPQGQSGANLSPLERARQTVVQIEQAAMEQRKLSSEVAEILGKRTARYEEELGRLENDSKRAGWEALAMAGFKMAQSQSPYFMSALASGMEAGLTGYNASKMARAERKARLQAAQEQVVLDREAQLNAAEEKERQRQLRALTATESALKLGQTGLASRILEETFPYQIEEAQLKPKETQARIAGEEASTRLKGAQAGYYERSPGAGADGEATTVSGLKPGKVADLLKAAQTNRARLVAKSSEPLIDPNVKAKLQQDIRLIDQEIAQYKQMLKLGGRAPTPTGNDAAMLRWDPKRQALVPNR